MQIKPKLMRKCVNCGEPATLKFGNDPDLLGIPSCENCKADVSFALVIAITEQKEFYEVLKGIKKD